MSSFELIATVLVFRPNRYTAFLPGLLGPFSELLSFFVLFFLIFSFLCRVLD